MTTPITRPPTETALQRERREFGELFDHFINLLFGRIFDLRPEKAQQRSTYLFLLFLLMGFLISLNSYSLSLWGKYIQDIFLYLLNPAYAASYAGNPLQNFLLFLFQDFTDARTLQYLPIFIAPFFIAVQLAAFYLADIFELEDVAVARSFVWEVALSGSDETMRISEGQVLEEHKLSSNYLIGGPGKVIVDLDSVALFERADGTPHVIGPTGREPGGKATIDGFERFRHAIDIRDQYIDLTVPSRSLDGIPITATDVRLMFSIDRGNDPKPSSDFPYPFSKDAIEKLVYRSSSKVLVHQPNPSSYDFKWIHSLSGMIRGRLGTFMSERNLSEYIASIGEPELEKLKSREEELARQVQEITTAENGSNLPGAKPPPKFTARYKITELFTQFADSMRASGLGLRWIGVGTWKAPPEIEIVSNKHLEAWKLSQENAKNGSKEALEKAEAEAIFQKMASLIKAGPLQMYRDIMGNNRFGRKQSARKQEPKTAPPNLRTAKQDLDDVDIDDENENETEGERVTKLMIDKLLAEYAASHAHDQDHEQRQLDPQEKRRILYEFRRQLDEVIKFMEAKNEAVPLRVKEARDHIDQQLYYMIKGSKPTK